MHRIPALAALVAASFLIVAAMIAAPSVPSNADLSYPAPGAQTSTATDEPYPPTLPIVTIPPGTVIIPTDDSYPPTLPIVTQTPSPAVYLPLIIDD